VRSTSRADERTAATRAAIRDAAIARFARDGFGVGLRTIAADAAVSPALIVHHFGSKDGLRAACDEHVLAVIAEQKTAAMAPSGGPAAAFAAMAQIDELAPIVGYAMQAIGSGDASAATFLDTFAADAEAWMADAVAAGVIKPSRDEKARIRYLTLVGFAAPLLDMRLHPPAEPGDLGTAIRGYLDRYGLAALELFSQGLYTDHRMLDAYLMYVTDPPATAGPDVPAP
jgi:AcrR family transcriptional regulator